MKRMLLLVLLLLVPLRFAQAEDALFPAMGENGKYGIISQSGDWVVPPEYDTLDKGRYTDIWILGRNDLETGLHVEGFFDIATGTFSGAKWYQVSAWATDSRLIPVFEWGKGWRLADRTTGELAVFQQNAETVFWAPPYFHEGVAVAVLADADGDPIIPNVLMNEQGEMIPLPEGMQPIKHASEGLVPVLDAEGRQGYVTLTGELAIPPQFVDAEPFSEGLAAVSYSEAECGYIDHTGSVLLLGFEYAGSFTDGLAFVICDGEGRSIDHDGNVVFILANP